MSFKQIVFSLVAIAYSAWVLAQPDIGTAPSEGAFDGPAPSSISAPQASAQSDAQFPDRSDRQAVGAFFESNYLTALGTTIQWTGSDASCNPGDTSAQYKADTLQMVNFYRAMVELPAVSLNATFDAKAQEAALMMRLNSPLNHFPPDTWTCYTDDGAEAAGKSNLARGVAGAASIVEYIKDLGSANRPVGHRRWILYPPQVQMGTGSTPNTNTLWVLGPFGARPSTPTEVAWPPAGYVPFELIYTRWSFSIPGANFADATISIERDGDPISASIVSRTARFGDNTIVFEPQDGNALHQAGMTDVRYRVTVANVGNAAASSYTYEVIVFDRNVEAPPEPPPALAVPFSNIFIWSLLALGVGAAGMYRLDKRT